MSAWRVADYMRGFVAVLLESFAPDERETIRHLQTELRGSRTEPDYVVAPSAAGQAVAICAGHKVEVPGRWPSFGMNEGPLLHDRG